MESRFNGNTVSTASKLIFSNLPMVYEVETLIRLVRVGGADEFGRVVGDFFASTLIL